MSGLVGGPFGPLKFGQLTLDDLSCQPGEKKDEKTRLTNVLFEFITFLFDTKTK